MKFTVPEQAKKKTERCEYNFSCLESGMCGGNPLCVVCQDTPGLLNRKAEGPTNCPYVMYSGHSLFCSCPTHLAIIEKYGDTEKWSGVSDPL